MGFLKRLLGGAAASFQDRVWTTSNRRLDDAVRRIARDAGDSRLACLAVHHFARTGEALRSRLEAEGLVVEELRQPGSERLEGLSTRLATGTVAVLRSDELPQEVKLGKGRRGASAGERTCHVHLVEHYPMLYRDTHVLNLHGVLPAGSAFFGYAALDEPWLERILGDQTRELLSQLGLSDSEALEHAMISKAMARAQAQLGRRLRKSEWQADSLEDWVRQNL